MPEIIACPRCQRKLRMDESVVGQTVQCPSCQHTFIAAMPDRSMQPPRSVEDDAPIYRALADDEPPPRRREVEDDEDYPRPPRHQRYDDYLKPHRGSTVRTLGILSLVFGFFGFCFPFPALVLAIVTIVMATTDLSAIGRGEMDGAGREPTRTGLICAIVAIVILGFTFFGCVGLRVFNARW